MTYSEVQAALYATLTADSDLQGALADMRDLSGDKVSGVPAVYDHTPQPSDGADNSWFPYLVIGQDVFIEWDTDDSTGFDAECTVHSWSRSLGRGEIKDVQMMVYNALHRIELPIAGHNVVTVDQTFADTTVDPDNKTRHGVQRFRIVLERV